MKTENVTTIISKKAQGISDTQISKDLGVSKETVAVYKNKHKEIINKTMTDLVEQVLPQLTGRYIDETEIATEIVKKIHDVITSDSIDVDSKNKQIKLLLGSGTNSFLARMDKKDENLLKAVGILATPTVAPVTNHIYNDNKTVITPLVLQTIHKASELIEDNIIDIEENATESVLSDDSVNTDTLPTDKETIQAGQGTGIIEDNSNEVRHG